MAFRGKSEVSPEAQDKGKGTPATTFIDRGCELSGNMCFNESVQIDGRIEGEIDAKKSVVVGESAHLQARISAETVVIHGSVDGDVAARRKITLHKTAEVSGDMRTAGIVIEEGAKFKGSIVIGSDDERPPEAKPAPPAGFAPLPGKPR